MRLSLIKTASPCRLRRLHRRLCLGQGRCFEFAFVQGNAQNLVQEAQLQVQDDDGGKNADYIPYLASVPSHLFGVVIATVDGQIFTAGMHDGFAIEVCLKAFHHVPGHAGAGRRGDR